MPELDQCATVFKALSDPLRLRLLRMLPTHCTGGCLGVCELADELGISQPCLSHHLNVLRQAGLVDFEKEGCSAFYYVNEDNLSGHIESFRRLMETE